MNAVGVSICSSCATNFFKNCSVSCTHPHAVPTVIASGTTPGDSALQLSAAAMPIRTILLIRRNCIGGMCIERSPVSADSQGAVEAAALSELIQAEACM